MDIDEEEVERMLDDLISFYEISLIHIETDNSKTQTIEDINWAKEGF